MVDEGTPAPRRALGPLPDDLTEGTAGGRFARGFSPAEPPSPSDTASFRRLAFSPTSPDSAEDPLDVPVSTPVPPPAPVLPEPEAALPPAAGRRFSASAEPGEFAYAPRRSAVSATSPNPPTGFVPAQPPVPPTAALTTPVSTAPYTAPTSAARTPSAGTGTASPTWPRPAGSGSPVTVPAFTPSPPTADSPSAVEPAADPATTEEPAKVRRTRRFGRRDRTAKAAAAATAPTTPASPTATPAATPASPTEPAHPGKRSRKPALIIIAAVAAVALIVAAGVWLLTLRSGAASGSPSNPVTASALDPLLTSADLAGLGGLTWAESTGTADDARPLCLPRLGAGLPEPQRTTSRRTTATDSQVASVVQVVDTYPDVQSATTAYNLRRTQAGTCKDDIAWISGANSVTGLADAADSVRVVVQDQPNQFHTLLLSRTGRSVSMVDVLSPDEAVPAIDVARVTATALSRQCGGELGTCPSGVGGASVPPPPGDPRGWLVQSDLPRVTPGAGRWGATDPFTALSVPGSQCEAINLETVPNTVSSGQRTFLLADDTSAPSGFGVDMVTYRFPDADDAKSLAGKLNKNIADCPDRAPTASVDEGPAVKGSADAGLKIAGSTYVITQKTETKTLVYRVAVLTVDTRLVFLLANPSTSFDFSDDQWKAIAVRAGQRATQEG